MPLTLKNIAPYFLERLSPYVQKPLLKGDVMKRLFAAILFVVLLAAVFIDPKKKNENHKDVSFEAQPLQQSDLNNATPVSAPTAPKKAAQLRATAVLASSRQEIPRHSTDSMPMGTRIPVALINNVISSNTETPIIAQVTEDVLGGGVSIPTESKAYGTARLNVNSQRLMVKFTAIVLPDGHELPISAAAIDEDMVYGLSGEFDSKEVDKTVASTAGQFISGLASGLKDKTPTPSGAPMEPGSLKNGVLNAFTQSGLGYAEKRAQDASSIQPVLRLPAGKQFYLFLERKFDG